MEQPKKKLNLHKIYLPIVIILLGYVIYSTNLISISASDGKICLGVGNVQQIKN